MAARPSKPQARAAEAISSRLDEIRDQVRGMIRGGALQPGERVNENALAAQLGVGRNSAREALRLLERSGLVRIVPNRGAQVRKVSLEEALDLYDVRSGLARAAGRLIATRLTPVEEAELATLMERMEEALRARDGAAHGELGTAFHRRLMSAAKNPRLVELNDAVEGELELYVRKETCSIARMQSSHDEHLRLFEAVRNGRAQEAAEAFEAHVLAGKQRMLDALARPPEH